MKKLAAFRSAKAISSREAVKQHRHWSRLRSGRAMSFSRHKPLKKYAMKLSALSRQETPNSVAKTMKKKFHLHSATSLCEDLCTKSRARSPWQVLCRSCCARFLCKVFCKMCPKEISTEELCKRSQSKISVQALYKRSLSKIHVLFTRSPYKISIRCLVARSLHKISIGGLLARSL